MATSPRCCMCRAIGAMSSWRDSTTNSVVTPGLDERGCVFIRKHSFAVSPHDLREGFGKHPARLKSEGVGNAGCTLHPRSRVQTCPKKRTLSYRFGGGTPAF